MAEKEIEPDYSPISKDDLDVYPVAPTTTIGESPPTTLVTIERIQARRPFRTEILRPYDVEVEYEPKELALDEISLMVYLSSYSKASISQESMTQLIRKHLVDVLETDDVFVEVSSDKKNTRLGSIL